jgi:cell wall assembly regulator SMI1
MTRVVLRCEGLYQLKAEGIADDINVAGGWPVRVSRLGLRESRLLQLARRDGEVGVLDEAARERVGATLERLADAVLDATLEVGGGGREVALSQGEIATHVLAHGLTPGTTYVLRWRAPDRRTEQDVAGDAAVDAAWEGIEHWFVEHHPRGVEVLAPGASDEALRALEETIGRPVPAPLRRSLARHDGQAEGVGSITEGHELLGAADMADEWTMMKEISDDLGEQDDWWRPSWLGFTADGMGNGLCLDAETGEVLFRDHQDSASPEARRFEGWLTRWAEELEAGEQVLDPQGDVELAWYADR